MLEEVIMNLQLTLTNVQSFAMETSLAMMKMQKQLAAVPVAAVPVPAVPVPAVPVPVATDIVIAPTSPSTISPPESTEEPSVDVD